MLLGDTCDSSAMLAIGAGADVLVHEATFDDESAHLAGPPPSLSPFSFLLFLSRKFPLQCPNFSPGFTIVQRSFKLMTVFLDQFCQIQGLKL